jgi:hypothetical protein
MKEGRKWQDFILFVMIFFVLLLFYSTTPSVVSLFLLSFKHVLFSSAVSPAIQMLPGVSYNPNYCLNKQVELPRNRILTPLNDVLDQNN